MHETHDTHTTDHTVEAVENTRSRHEAPAIRFLDALRAGDDLGVLEVCGPATTMSAPGMGWSCEGADEILGILAEARRHFLGLMVEPCTRDIGFGLVIDEVRAQDVLQPEPERTDGQTSVAEPGEPASAERALSVWREDYLTPMRLNLPARITVRHDDLQVHEIVVEFPAALLKRALGIYVDPLEMSLSEVQSAFIAREDAGFTTRTLVSPRLASETEAEAEPEVPAGAAAETAEERPRRRRRGRVLVPLLVTLLAVAAASGWWFLRGPGSAHDTASVAATGTHAVSQAGAHATAVAQVSTRTPTVTHAQPSQTPSGKPNVTLHSDLAFGFNSSTLSPQAKQAIDQVARQVRSAGLSGRIYVDGYTDDLGSQAYGLVLSQRRADAVAHYLGSQLAGVPVSIVSTGHGESHPVADNSTSQGRKDNRRVTLTLPTS